MSIVGFSENDTESARVTILGGDGETKMIATGKSKLFIDIVTNKPESEDTICTMFKIMYGQYIDDLVGRIVYLSSHPIFKLYNIPTYQAVSVCGVIAYLKKLNPDTKNTKNTTKNTNNKHNTEDTNSTNTAINTTDTDDADKHGKYRKISCIADFGIFRYMRDPSDIQAKCDDVEKLYNELCMTTTTMKTQ